MRCRGLNCKKELNPEKDKIYNFYGLPLCEDCVSKGKPIILDPEATIGILIED